MVDNIIRLDGVTKKFGKKAAVDNVTLNVPKGQILSLLGPNGAGKSSLINMMLGILSPSSGIVLIDHKNPAHHYNRRSFGAMLQHTGLPDTLRPVELVSLWRSYYRRPLPMEEILSVAGINDIKDTLFGKLSSGQKRRVAFALAISGDPELVFLDEPSAGLDLQSRALLWEEIRKLAAREKTVVLCTHYLDEADVLSDRIVLMNKGGIIADATPLEIKNMVGAKTIRFSTTLCATTFLRLPYVTNAHSQSGKVIVETSDADAVLKLLLAGEYAVSDIEVTSVSLEDAFLKLTKQ